MNEASCDDDDGDDDDDEGQRILSRNGKLWT